MAFLVGAVLFLAGFLFGKNLGFDTMAVIGYTTIFLSLIFVFFGIRHYRDHENNGEITLGRAIGIGICISLFSALGFALIDYIYTSQINPDFTKDYLAHSIESLKATAAPENFEAEKAALIKENEAFGSPVILALFMFTIVTVLGFIISLISALILQRK